MARRYRVTVFRRAGNVLVGFMARRGMGPSVLLTTIGRKTGKPRTVPVTPTEFEGARYLVSPYGDVGWVHNLRVSGTAELQKGSAVEQVRATEIRGRDAARVTEPYYAGLKRILSPFFDVPDDPTLDDFEAEAARHPVFRIEV